MSAPRRVVLFVLLCLAGVPLAGCDGLGRPVKIGQVLANPAKYQDRSVTVRGTVTEAVSVLSLGYCIVKDDTGTIAVHPAGAAPLVGSEVTIRGRVRTIFTLGDKSMLVLEQRGKKKTT